MRLRSCLVVVGLLAAVLPSVLPAVAHADQPAAARVTMRPPHVMPRQSRGQDSPLQPPAPPCFNGCVALPEAPAAGAPMPGNMAYWGGHVQVHPKVFLVFLGWGSPGAFDGGCQPERVGYANRTAVLRCDPDGAGRRAADFVSQLGGTEWAGVQSQYYQVVGGKKTYVSNDKNQLAGIWVDDTGPLAGASPSYDMMAQEAYLAARHFKVPESDWINSDFVIVQPRNYSDPKATNYCAFHSITSNGIPFTNLPYVYAMTSCGEGSVNSGPAGRLDSTTIVLGHEIEETVTDPDVYGYSAGRTTGGWYDALDRDENADKCVYVGAGMRGFPGAPGAIRGNRGGLFPVQSLWSNEAAGGAGYCAGAGTDLPF